MRTGPLSGFQVWSRRKVVRLNVSSLQWPRAEPHTERALVPCRVRLTVRRDRLMARDIRRVEDAVDAEGFVVAGGYSAWDCDRCGKEVRRYRGVANIDCGNCGASYNAVGQRLRDDWRGNASNYDDDVSDMDGYENQHADR